MQEPRLLLTLFIVGCRRTFPRTAGDKVKANCSWIILPGGGWAGVSAEPYRELHIGFSSCPCTPKQHFWLGGTGTECDNVTVLLPPVPKPPVFLRLYPNNRCADIHSSPPCHYFKLHATSCTLKMRLSLRRGEKAQVLAMFF